MLVTINVKEIPEMRDTFRVAGLPTVVLAKPRGEEIDRTLGFMPADEFLSTIEGYHKGIGTLAAMKAEEEEKKADPQFLFDLGEKFYAHSLFDDADERFAGVIKSDSTNTAGLASKAQLNRARISGKAENWPLAIAFCQALVKRWPGSVLIPDATVYAGYYADRAGQTDDAIAAYTEYIEKWPEGEDAEWAKEQIEKLQNPSEED